MANIKNFVERNLFRLIIAGFSVIHALYFLLLSFWCPQKFIILIIWNVVSAVAAFLMCFFYKNKYRSLIFAAVVADVICYSLISIIVTGMSPGYIILILSFIPSLFLFTEGLRKPKYYNLVLNCILIIAAGTAVYLKIRFLQPLSSLSPELREFYRNTFLLNIILVFSELELASWNMSNKLLKIKRKSAGTYKEVAYVAKHDVLTKMMNRRRIAEILESCTEQKQTDGSDYAICIFDIDNFKNINDTYGHDCGDFVLKEFTRAIRARIPLPAKIGRWGGEEFLILYPIIHDDTIFELDRIRKEVSDLPFVYKGTTIYVSATFGISSSRQLTTSEEVLSDADYRLLEGKEHGKNRVVVSEKF